MNTSIDGCGIGAGMGEAEDVCGAAADGCGMGIGDTGGCITGGCTKEGTGGSGGRERVAFGLALSVSQDDEFGGVADMGGSTCAVGGTTDVCGVAA